MSTTQITTNSPANRTLHIHETVIADAAFKIACDLANKHPEVGGVGLGFAAVEATILHCLRHQLHLQSTWCTEDEEFGSRQLWARPVHPVPPVV